MTSKATNTRILYLSIDNLPYYSLKATGLILASLNSPTVCTLSIPHTLSPSLFTINNSMEFIASRPFHPPATTIALKRKRMRGKGWDHHIVIIFLVRSVELSSTEEFASLSIQRETQFNHPSHSLHLLEIYCRMILSCFSQSAFLRSNREGRKGRGRRGGGHSDKRYL